jgi:hypothetical protein
LFDVADVRPAQDTRPRKTPTFTISDNRSNHNDIKPFLLLSCVLGLRVANVEKRGSQATGFVGKPFEMAHLLKAVRDALAVN